MTTYQIENWIEFYPDCIALFEEHEAELGEGNPKMPLDPAYDAWRAMDQMGVLSIMTARVDDKLVGYCLFVLSANLKSRNVLCAEQKLWFVTKSHRRGGIGIKLFTKSVEFLKNFREVKNIYPHRWTTVDSEVLDKFFKSLGAVEIERQYSLWIGD